MRIKWRVVRRRMGQRVGVLQMFAKEFPQHDLQTPTWRVGDYDGPAVATFKSSSQKARAASRSKPIQDQIVETEAFISRAQKRLSVLEEERVREQELLDKAWIRQERLQRDLEIERKEQPCALPDVSALVHRLEAAVAELRKERDDLRQNVEGRRVCG